MYIIQNTKANWNTTMAKMKVNIPLKISHVLPLKRQARHFSIAFKMDSIEF